MYQVKVIDKESEIMWDVRSLYDSVFCDSREYTEFFFDKVVPERTTEVLGGFENDELVSIMFIRWNRLLYCGMRRRGSFFYGVTTKEEHRGKGYCRKMIEFAINYCQENSADIIYLIPADAGIYEKMGFSLVRDAEMISLIEAENAEGDYEISKITLEEQTSTYAEMLSFYAISAEETEKCITIEKDEKYFTMRLEQAEAEKAGIYIVCDKNKPIGVEDAEAIVITSSSDNGRVYVSDIISPYDERREYSLARLVIDEEHEIMPFMKKNPIMIYKWDKTGIDIKLNNEI